jgi:hypothetical protein
LRLLVGLGYALGCGLVVALSAFAYPFAAFVLLPICLAICGLHFFRARLHFHSPAGWPALLAGNALVFAFLASSVFLCFEVYYRFFCDQTDAMTYTLVSQRWYERHFHKNNFGVRDNIDYSYKLTPGRPRVTFVGDSCTAGFGVKDVENRFVNRVRQAHPEWEVHSIGIPGLDTSTELLQMHNLTVSNGYQIDQLVLIYNLNDIGELMPRWVEEYKKMLADPFWKSWLCQNSYFLNLLYHRWQIGHHAYFRHYFDEVEEAYKGPLWEREKRGLNGFRNMALLRGGRLLVVTFPYLDAMDRFRFANQQLNRYWEEAGIAHLDLLDVFSNHPPAKLVVNPHDAHPNELAHTLAANAIDAFLKREVTNSVARPPSRP